MHITCDYELKEWEHTFTEMTKRYSYCSEAYFGLGKIYFSRNLISEALEYFELALKGPKRDPGYCLWAAMSLFYLYKKAQKKNKPALALKIERYWLECLEKNDKDFNSLFIYLHTVLDATEKLKSSKYKPRYQAEDIAVKVKNGDNYKGYLAWTELYVAKGNTEFAIQVLEELIEYYPENPDAYFRLCQLYKPDSDEAWRTAEKMFLSCTTFHMLETK